MKNKMNSKYSPIQVVFHWISAIIILWAIVSGFSVAFFDIFFPYKDLISYINVSLTTIFIPILLLRIIFCFLRGKPENTHLKKLEQFIASCAHVLIYINMVIVMITGVLMMESPITVFGWFEFSQPVKDSELTSVFRHIHTISCMTLTALIFLHIIAVVKHQIKGHAILRKMSL
ncbi:cytochrome b/b6 domain-containing protein (plasmid) [Pantoea sp. BJ2]|uniref:Cytochrome b/b6 domain-containing protein n=1 Tax=Pantoea sp. BJ2 TaxID=3141322 RepID=A0AAU7U3X7_9GAMM